jgi:hypothetical protein
MSESQLERGLEYLYSDTSVRDELTDDEARELLQWGEAQITQLAGQEMDDEQFDEAFAHLRKLISRINRFTGRRSGMDAEEQQTAVQRIAESAATMAAQSLSAQAAPDFSAERLNAYLQRHAALDNIANIHALTSLVAPPSTTAESTPADAVTSAEPAPSAPLTGSPSTTGDMTDDQAKFEQ